MLIYNKDWIDNLAIQEQASVWLKKNLLTREEHAAIVQQYATGYHAPNIFARTGMFLFTLVITVSAVGLFNLFTFADIGLRISMQCLFFGGIFYFAAERFTRRDHYFRSGVIDALLYGSVFSVSIGLIILLSGNDFEFSLDPVIYISIVLPFMIFVSIRFRDAFLALCAFAGIFALNALLVLKAGTIGKLILPFEGMLFSLVAYRIIKKQKAKEEFRFWKKNFMVLEVASLVTFYLSGNYLVVRQLSEMLLDTTIAPGADIAFAYFFYAFTLVIPLVYVVLGLKQKDYLLIYSGVLLEVAGILSIRYYYSVLPPETALTLAGIFLVVVAWLSISYLKTPRNGITSLEEDQGSDEAFDAIGSILVSQAAGKAIPASPGTKFGGGSSGGGGAGGEF